MSGTGLSPPRPESIAGRPPIQRSTFLKYLIVIVGVTFLLRIAYSGHLCDDDGLWFTSAEQMLRGKALYREIYFDKPPLLPLVYAGLFSLFGAHIIVVRLFTIVYSIAISGVLYLFGSELYGKREGLLAAALFAFFSTNPVNNHFQSLNTDFLMLLFYVGAAYSFVRARTEDSIRPAFLGGVLSGLAIQTNPKGLFDLIFFGVLLVLTGVRLGKIEPHRAQSGGAQDASGPGRLPASLRQQVLARYGQRFIRRAQLFAIALAGVLAASAPLMAYLFATQSLSYYYSDVWRWGAAYASYYPISRLATRGLPLTGQYLLLNNTLLFGLIFVAASTYRRLRSNPAPGERSVVVDRTTQRALRSDATLLIWFAVSFAGVAFGWRFYSNYFFQILPSLCLLAARGLSGAAEALRTKSAVVRRIAVTVLALGFMVTLVRFHTRTATLAFDFLRGSKSGSTARWYHEVLNHEERMAAAVVRDLPGGADAADRIGIEAMRDASRGPRSGPGGADYLFVWGARVGIYYWSGLIPASKYLSTQPLTGIPADAHYDEASRSVLAESETAAARAELAGELEVMRPKFIVDEMGFYNAKRSIQNYPELVQLMRHYENLGATATFLIYRRKDLESE